MTQEEINKAFAKVLFGKNAEKILLLGPWSIVLLKATEEKEDRDSPSTPTSC